jgi:hypothetical protein
MGEARRRRLAGEQQDGPFIVTGAPFRWRLEMVMTDRPPIAPVMPRDEADFAPAHQPPATAWVCCSWGSGSNGNRKFDSDWGTDSAARSVGPHPTQISQ